MKQEAAKVTDQDFIDADDLLRRELVGQGSDCTWYCKSFNPYPFVLSLKEYEHQARLQRCVFLAITGIVERYHDDVRVQKILSLPESAVAMLRNVRELPFKIGTYRPDFLHDTAGGIKICEINARFPTNAYFITHYINNVVASLRYLPRRLKRLTVMDGIPSAFAERFDSGSKIAILKERERGWDIKFFDFEMEKRGYSTQHLGVHDFAAAADADGFVIELHQDELFQDESKIVGQLCAEKPHFNDLRTIFFGHDKRLLAVFHDDEIMTDVLDADDRTFLKDNVVETYTVGNINIKNEANRNKNDWVLKPNLLGKGEGMMFGHTTDDKAWSAALDDPRNRDFVLQKFVEQKKFQIRARIGNEVSMQELNVVGTLLCFDEQFFGPGIYRASKGDIVNVAGGGMILFPMMESDDA